MVSVVFRCVEGSGCPYHHDRYSDCTAVVHLRLSQGLLPPAPPTAPRDARVPEEEARPHGVKTQPLLPFLHWASASRRRLIWTPEFHSAPSSFLYLCPRLVQLCSEHRAATRVYLKQAEHGELSLTNVELFLCRNPCLVWSISVIRKYGYSNKIKLRQILVCLFKLVCSIEPVWDSSSYMIVKGEFVYPCISDVVFPTFKDSYCYFVLSVTTQAWWNDGHTM